MCITNWSAPTVRQSLDPVAGLKDAKSRLTPKIPDPPAPPVPPQTPQAPSTTPLKRRNAGGIAVPAGSTLLSGPSGVAASQLTLGSQTLLGGS